MVEFPTTIRCLNCDELVKAGPYFAGERDASFGLLLCSCTAVDVNGCDRRTAIERIPDHWEEVEVKEVTHDS